MSSFNFLRIAGFYTGMALHFQERTDLSAVSYQDACQAFFAQAYSLADFYEQAFTAQGIHTTVIPANVPYLQELWRAEQGTGPLDWLGTLRSQLRHYNPDVVMVDEVSYCNEKVLAALRAEFPSVKVWFCSHCAPLGESGYRTLAAYDFVMTCCPGVAEDLTARGISPLLVRHAFYPGILRSVSATEQRDLPFTFVGSLIPGLGFHGQRFRLIDRLVQGASGLEVFGKIATVDMNKKALKRLLVRLHGIATKVLPEAFTENCPCAGRVHQWDALLRFPTEPSFQQVVHPPVFGLDMFSILGRSRVTLNNHGDIARFAANMRLYEATGMGACLLTDWKPDLGELFAIDSEVVAYRSDEECLEKALYLLEHPEKALEIGLAGQRRCLRDHTTFQRAEILREEILRRLS